MASFTDHIAEDDLALKVVEARDDPIDDEGDQKTNKADKEKVDQSMQWNNTKGEIIQQLSISGNYLILIFHMDVI